jgi:hypothetical protein
VFFGSGDVDRFGVEHRWNQECLGCQLPFVERPLELLVEDAFVRRMHVDDDQPLGVLRQDVDAVQLGKGVAERRYLAVGGGQRPRRLGGRQHGRGLRRLDKAQVGVVDDGFAGA